MMLGSVHQRFFTVDCKSIMTHRRHTQQQPTLEESDQLSGLSLVLKTSTDALPQTGAGAHPQHGALADEGVGDVALVDGGGGRHVAPGLDGLVRLHQGDGGGGMRQLQVDLEEVAQAGDGLQTQQ